jgi:hypothetical protein
MRGGSLAFPNHKSMPHSLIKEQEKQYNRRSMKISKAEGFHQVVKKVLAFTFFALDFLWNFGTSVVRGSLCCFCFS